jgi:hypothetical protein
MIENNPCPLLPETAAILPIFRVARLWTGFFTRTPRTLPQARRHTPPAIHRSCGQLCGQPVAVGRKPAQMQGFQHFAQKLGGKFPLKINHLHVYDRAVTKARQGLRVVRRLVEFSSPVSGVRAGV